MIGLPAEVRPSPMPRRHFKTDRLLLLAIAVSLAAATGIYYLIQRSKGLAPRLASDKALLSALAATVVILFLGLERFLEEGLTAGGVKG